MERYIVHYRNEDGTRYLDRHGFWSMERADACRYASKVVADDVAVVKERTLARPGPYSDALIRGPVLVSAVHESKLALKWKRLKRFFTMHAEMVREGNAYEWHEWLTFGYVARDVDHYGVPSKLKQTCPNPLWLDLVAYFCWHMPVAALRASSCDHSDWEDTSCIGPDSGTESGHCRRCGFSFDHTYY